MRTSTIILSKNIRIDKDYINVLSYNVEQMLNLLKSSNNLVKMISNCSFLRDRNYFTIEIDYNSALKVNYLAFTNPDYSNKWFFAFVDKVEYVSNKAVNIYYTIDHWTTWFDDWKPAKAFVIREHTLNDAIGANTIEEGLDLGEMVNNGDPIELGTSTMQNPEIIVALTQNILDTISLQTNTYRGTYSGLFYAVFTSVTDLNKFLKALASLGKNDIVNSIFYLPQELVGAITYKNVEYGGQTFSIGQPNNTYSPYKLFDTSFAINTSLDGYTPTNKKLLCYPYNYFILYNNAGDSAIFHYEDFENNKPRFKAFGTMCVGGSIRAIPVGYKNISYFNTDPSQGYYYTNIYGLTAGKYPVCGWVSDVYTNWLTQNSLNIQSGFFASTLNTATGLASGSASGAVSGINQLIAQYQAVRQHQFVPTQANGAVNSGDLMNAGINNFFYAYRICLRKEIAQSIDDLFSRYGYKTLRYKIPNISTRSTFNYLQISNDSVIGTGDVPAESMSIINNVARRGVTIYQNHSLI